jgi:hypothetical protein
MLKELQRRADDLAERVLICELELHKARNLAMRMQAFHDFCNLVVRLEILRRDAEAILHSDRIVARLDKKVRNVAGSEPYQVASWFATQAPELSWLICPATFAPMNLSQPC